MNIKPIYNLAYSPDLNPIESVFALVKRIFNRERLQKLANMEAFDSQLEVENAFYKINNSKIDNCIRHSNELLENMNNLA